MALARRHQIKVVERTILPEEIAGASEVFLAGTAAEVTPVRQIGDLHFTPGPVTERLLHEYEALVQMPPEKVSALAA
jgi:branched-chain amino acid aminotransferase